MASETKPWELPLSEHPDFKTAGNDSRIPDSKETDALLSGKHCERFVEDDGCDFSCGLKGFMAGLNQHFGYKLLWLLFAAQFLVKGFFKDFVGKAEPYLYKLYHVPGTQTQIYSGVTSLPWAMKPILGLASDIFPICGYNKAPYMLVTSILGVVATLLVGACPTATLPIIAVVMCFFLIQMQGSAADLLSEAKYAEKMRLCPSHGAALMTYVWFGMQIGGLAAVLFSGVIIARFGPHAVYALAAIPASSILIPIALNYLEETPLSDEQLVARRAFFMSQKETCFLCALMFAATVTLMGVGVGFGPKVAAVVGLVVAVIVLTGFSIFLSPVIARFNAFSLIQTSMSLSVGGASFYFFTDTPEQYPEGPHFTPFFYNSVMGVVQCIFSLIGIYCYQRFMSTWKYRNILVVTNLAYCLINLLDVVMYTRLNLKLGIPDHAFLLGASSMQNMINQWQWMPQVVILSFLCPKGMEATMYALLAGCHNMGNTIASNCGAVVLQWLNCAPRGLPAESSQFTNLWKASALSTCLPLLTILLLFWLIPDSRQNETILDASEESATTGSLWERWTSRHEEA